MALLLIVTLAAASCGGSPTGTPLSPGAKAGPATGVPTGPSTEPTAASACPRIVLSPSPCPATMTVLSLPSGDLILWPRVPDAEEYVLKRTGSKPVRVAGTETTYTWADDLLADLDLTRAAVRPVLFSVEAVRGDHVLHRFVRGRDCPELVFIAARGSGQNGTFTPKFGAGLGDRGERVLTKLREELELGKRDLPAIGVPYPAVAVALGPGGSIEPGTFGSIYDKSVGLGVAATKFAIVSVLRACTKTRLVLFGYSQGAQVIGLAFGALDAVARNRVARVILFADAQYRPADPRVRYLPTAPSGVGIKGARGPFPRGDGAVIESWCWDQDAVCQRPPHGHAFHGPVYDGYETQAAHSAAQALRGS
jgi:hypothetical protein